MAYLHTETITRACAELNPGESYVLQFPTPKDAHNEYCYFRTALRAAVQKSPLRRHFLSRAMALLLSYLWDFQRCSTLLRNGSKLLPFLQKGQKMTFLTNRRNTPAQSLNTL